MNVKDYLHCCHLFLFLYVNRAGAIFYSLNLHLAVIKGQISKVPFNLICFSMKIKRIFVQDANSFQ